MAARKKKRHLVNSTKTEELEEQLATNEVDYLTLFNRQLAHLERRRQC